MFNREKVISTLEEIKTQTAEIGLDSAVIAHKFIDKILALLKEQEGVEPIFDCEEPILQIGQFHCGNCNHSFGISHYRYCPYCGKLIKWKGE